jgi:hypothetical protein
VPPAHSCLQTGPPSRELTEVFCRVPSTQFSQAPWYALPVHLCRFRVRSNGGLFPGTTQRPVQSDKNEQPLRSVTSSWLWNINQIPIDYAFRPRLRGRLTLLRLALSRNPWTFGESVSHTLYRYSRQHSHFPALHPTSRSSFTAQGTLRYHACSEEHASSASARGLSPVTSSPQDSLTRPVSCYAFFK